MPHAPQCGVKHRREVRLWVWSFAGVRPLIDATFKYEAIWSRCRAPPKHAARHVKSLKRASSSTWWCCCEYQGACKTSLPVFTCTLRAVWRVRHGSIKISSRDRVDGQRVVKVRLHSRATVLLSRAFRDTVGSCRAIMWHKVSDSQQQVVWNCRDAHAIGKS